MSAVIVTDGAFAQLLLEQMVRQHPLLRSRELRVSDAGEWSGAQSKARTILVLKHQPVALVADAGAFEPEGITEQRCFLEWGLEQVAPRHRWRVILLIPQVEGLLFRNERLLRALVEDMPSFEQTIRARYEPRRVFAELMRHEGRRSLPAVLPQRLAQAELMPLWALPEFLPLESFLLEKSAAQQPPALP